MSFRLNDRQQEAVQATEGPVLVIAGAGSGKTRVLTERIAYLVQEKGIHPYNILAFTFTNRAAREMRERLEQSSPGISERLWVGTFHATGVKILRSHGREIGVSDRFTIYDADDSLDLIKDILSRQGLHGQLIRSPRAIRDQISRWKNDLMTPDLVASGVTDNLKKRIVSVYREYERALARANALDFDDLIARVVELFSVHSQAKDHFARRFQYVLVDEFQDTNPIQMALIDALASYHKNLFVVGDDDQSIYSWRGAKVDHILNFEDLYSGTRVVRLEQNYRSTQMILDAANHVIAHNKGRKGKNLWTDGDRGEKVGLIVSMDEETEAMNMLNTVNTLVTDGHQLRDIAVLYRTNAQSRALEDVLKLGGLPYQIIGAVRFYERMEVRDILAYCKLLVNPADNISLKRILNVPRRALGKTTYENLSVMAGKNNVSIMEILKTGVSGLGTAQIKRCAEFVKLFTDLEGVAAREEAPAVIQAVLDETKYRDYLRDGFPDSDSRVENVDELVTAAEIFTETSEDRSLRAFLEEIALVADIDTWDEVQGQLTLMTLHNAKGLEFDCVIIAGVEEGLVPHYNSLDKQEDLEEERRLFYVGMTRARKRLFLSYANMRRRMGIIEGGSPSRFLYEVPEECLDGSIASDENLLFAETDSDGTAGRPMRFFEGRPRAATQKREFEDYSQEEVYYTVGMRVIHNDFGKGVVRRVEGAGENLRVTVIFDGGGERKFLAHYAPMRPMN
ncbi:MAG: UvrD-helicase domain-containing protein [Candidatus Latescibacterota bacterium]|nr:MAG: UvrD-helicase domain-containing protein [Candidatus Latescibacterota bacterium]